MFQFHIVTVGAMKKGPLADLVLEFEKRLRPFAKIERTEIKDVRPIKSGAFTVLLTEHGKGHFSGDFANQLLEWSEHETRQIQFVIAGPFGVDKHVEKLFDATLSLSKLTFPHDVATMLLYEQLYRGMTILAGKTYHY